MTFWWLIATVLLYGARNQRARRAALRGFLSAALTTTILTTWHKLGGARSRFGSMVGEPSAETAGATAFAAGAFLELRAAGVPLGAVAALSTWLRLRRGE
ncbi:MAG: hypothetical protein M3238_00915, partial [Actinomycetota bacterium]|nr:hypothetical protein [Actinomycetota bacterium]